MSYALVVNGEMIAVRNPGRHEIKLLDGKPLAAPDGHWTPELAAVCGFVEVVETPRPEDTETTTYESNVDLIDGLPTRVHVARAKSPEEIASQNTLDADQRLEMIALSMDALQGSASIDEVMAAIRDALDVA